MFRTIVILGVLAVCAFMAGWFTIDRSDEETTIRFDRDEIRADASKAIAKGRELFKDDKSEQTAQNSFFGKEQIQLPTADEILAPLANEFSGLNTEDFDFTPQQATRSVPPWQQPLPAGGGQQY